MKKIILKIDGMSCSGCQNRVEKYLNKQNGVKASVNLVMAQALIEYDEKIVTIDDLNHFIEEAGYKSLGIFQEDNNKFDKQKKILFLLAILMILFMAVSMSNLVKNPKLKGLYSIIFTIPYLWFGKDILKNGITKIFHPNMDSLIALGVLTSYFYSCYNYVLILLNNSTMNYNLYFTSTAMIIYFVKIGRFIDKKSKEKTKEAIKELVTITPKKAVLKEQEKEITIDEVKKSDILICKPGMKVAVDGKIIKGNAHFEEAFINGESIPSKKKKGDLILAGSINLDGYIEYEALKIGPDSTISEIVKLVMEAATTKSPIAKLADSLSGIFAPLIILISFLTLIGYLFFGYSLNDAIISMVTVLLVSCPCSLGLATPLAIVVAEGIAAKKGILIRSSETLETVHKIDTIVFDKTGTLTHGKLQVSKIYNYSKLKDSEILNIIANMEEKSNHPIATSFKTYLNKKIKVTNFENMNGIGIKGFINKKEVYIGNNKLFNKLKITNEYEQFEQELTLNGNSIVYLIEEKKVKALIGIKDTIRKNAKKVITDLKKINKNIILLSGDNEKTASIVAKELGIERVIANVLPIEKEKILESLTKDSRKVMMVGDGINDAPSLVTATIGVSLKSGTDIAVDSSDVILLNDDLSKIIDLFMISKKTIKVIKQNLFWAFFYNILMIPVAIGLLKGIGIALNPMLASLAMTLSSLSVVVNSLQLKASMELVK